MPLFKEKMSGVLRYGLIIVIIILFLAISSQAVFLKQTNPGDSSSLGLLISPAQAFGVGDTGLDETGGKTGLSKPKVPEMIGQIIKIVLSLIGVLFFILMLYGGFLWMTAHGNEQQVIKARQILTQATIGLAIVLASYGIAHFVIQGVISATA